MCYDLLFELNVDFDQILLFFHRGGYQKTSGGGECLELALRYLVLNLF